MMQNLLLPSRNRFPKERSITSIFFASSPLAKGCCRILMLLLTMPASGFVYAMNEIDEADLLAEIPIIFSATRQSQHISEAPSSVTIISREMIQAMGSVNITDLFRLVPGFQTYSVNGSWFGVTSHGLSDKNPRRLEVRINGRSAHTALRSSISWASLGITQNDIDHIEVVRGSNVPAYGSNAILGAINIITISPLMASGTELNVTVGSWETRNTSISHAIQTSNSRSVVRAAYRENNGFSHVEDDAYVGHITFHSLITPSVRDSVEIEAGYSDANIGFGDGDHLDEFVSEYVNWGWLNANWERSGDYGRIRTHFDISHANFDRSRKVLLSGEIGVDPEIIPQLYPGQKDLLLEPEDGERTYRQATVEVEHHYSVNPRMKLVWGGGLRYEELKNPIALGDPDYIDNLIKYFFTNTEWHINPYFGMNLGLMWEDFQIADDYLSPRIAFNFHPFTNHHLRISATKANRAPSIFEAEHFQQFSFPDGQEIDFAYSSAPGLSEETVRTYEAGYLGYWFDGKLSLDYKLFREYMEDGIDVIKFRYDDIDGRVWHNDNTAHWRTSGFETQLQLRPAQGLLISVQYANTRVDGFRYQRHKRDFRIVKNEKVQHASPHHTASALISYVLPTGWLMGLTYYHNSYTDWRQGIEVDSWSRYDLHIKKSWHIGDQDLAIGLTVQNLFDEEYLEYQDNNIFEQLSFINIQVSF